jgi:hypothetical protein
MAGWIELAIALLAIILIWYFIAVRFRGPRAGPAGDPEALVGAGLNHPPGGRSGAVALDEPDDEE